VTSGDGCGLNCGAVGCGAVGYSGVGGRRWALFFLGSTRNGDSDDTSDESHYNLGLAIIFL
jgi:hypothetical protein